MELKIQFTVLPFERRENDYTLRSCRGYRLLRKCTNALSKKQKTDGQTDV